MQLRVTALPAATVASCHTLLGWWHRRAAPPELIQWAWFARGSMACTATVVACSSCHGSSARCPLIKWRLPIIESIIMRIYESFGSSVGWQIHTCKHALCMPSSHTATVCSRRHAEYPLYFARAPIPDAVEAKALRTRRLGDGLSSESCLLGFYAAWKLTMHALRTRPPYATG